MNVMLITAVIASLFVPTGTAWIVALGREPMRVALRLLASILTIELVVVVALHTYYYSTRAVNLWWGLLVMGYIAVLGVNSILISLAIDYIKKHHEKVEPPKAPKPSR